MTPEEQLAEFRKRKQLEQFRAAKSSAVKSREKEAAWDDMSAWDKATDIAMGLQEGQLLGFRDEIVGAGRAVVDPIFDMFLPELPEGMERRKESFGDRYRRLRDAERAKMDKYREGAGGLAMATEMIGGLATPGLGVVGNTAKGATTGVRGAVNRGAQALDDFGRGGGRQAASQAAARAAAEGSVAGLGASEAEDLEGMTKDALTGGATGLAVTTGLRGGGKLLGGLSADRASQDLVDKTGRRMPLSMDDSTVGSLYRSIARIPGARGRIQELERPFVEEAQQGVYDAEQALVRARQAEEARKLSAGESMENTKLAEAQRLADEADAAREAAEANRQNILEGRAARETATQEDLARTTQDRLDAIEFRAQEAMDAAENLPARQKAQAEAQFRRTAALEALPPEVRSRLDDIDVENDIDSVRSTLDNYWNKDAFQEVKSRNFDWDGDVDSGLMQNLRDAMAEDPNLAITLGKEVGKLKSLVAKLQKAGGAQRNDIIDEEFAKLLTDAEIKGIDGKALMEIRNVFARNANDSSSRSARYVASQIDDLIKRQLSPEDIAKYEDNLGRYTTALSYMGASSGKKARENAGRFTPGQYMASSGKYSGSLMNSRTPPLELEARGAIDEIAGAADRRAEAISGARADTTAARKAARRKAQKEARDARRRNQQATRQENAQLAAERRGLTRAQAQAQRDARARQLRANRAERRTALQNKQALESGPLRTGLTQAVQQARELDEKLVPRRLSPLSDYFTAGQAGSVVPMPIPNQPARAGAGLLVGRAVASDMFQDLLAGQTELQRAIRKALEEGDLATYNRLIAREAALRSGE